METVLAFLEKIGNYLLLVSVTDILDVIIIAFLVYKLLDLVRSTRAENILKGVVIFLLALWLSEIIHLYGIAYILGNMVQVGILALIILFQPEIRQILEKLGSRNIRLRDGQVIEDTTNPKILSAAEALAALPKNDED